MTDPIQLLPNATTPAGPAPASAPGAGFAAVLSALATPAKAATAVVPTLVPGSTTAGPANTAGLQGTQGIVTVQGIATSLGTATSQGIAASQGIANLSPGVLATKAGARTTAVPVGSPIPTCVSTSAATAGVVVPQSAVSGVAATPDTPGPQAGTATPALPVSTPVDAAAPSISVADPASPGTVVPNAVAAPVIPVVPTAIASQQPTAGAIAAVSKASNIESTQGLVADIAAASLLATSPASPADLGSVAGSGIAASAAEVDKGAAPPATLPGTDPATALAAAPAPAQAAPAAATSSGTPSNVARQVAPVLIQVAHGASGSAVTLQLDPLGLGHVQVRVDRNADGTATIQVTAERPETLRLLVADQPHLHTALDSAGVATDGRTLSFALATSGGSTSGGGDGGAANSGSNGGQAGSGRNARWAAGSDDETSFINQPAWIRAGVDITA
jgi:flagellar hook-length control protein FliK